MLDLSQGRSWGLAPGLDSLVRGGMEPRLQSIFLRSEDSFKGSEGRHDVLTEAWVGELTVGVLISL